MEKAWKLIMGAILIGCGLLAGALFFNGCDTRDDIKKLERERDVALHRADSLESLAVEVIAKAQTDRKESEDREERMRVNLSKLDSQLTVQYHVYTKLLNKKYTVKELQNEMLKEYEAHNPNHTSDDHK